MDRPEYWQDDEIWASYEHWLSKQPKLNLPEEFMSPLRKAIEIARGNQDPPKFPVQFD